MWYSSLDEIIGSWLLVVGYLRNKKEKNIDVLPILELGGCMTNGDGDGDRDDDNGFDGNLRVKSF